MTACGDESRRGQAAVADSDLGHLLAEWEPRARINECVPGKHDVWDRLLIADKSDGRAPDLEPCCAPSTESQA